MSNLSLRQDTWLATIAYDRETQAERMTAVHRWYWKDDIIYMERWDPETGEWVNDPGLTAAIGIGGDSDYVPISQEQAEAFITQKQGVASNAQ